MNAADSRDIADRVIAVRAIGSEIGLGRKRLSRALGISVRTLENVIALKTCQLSTYLRILRRLEALEAAFSGAGISAPVRPPTMRERIAKRYDAERAKRVGS